MLKSRAYSSSAVVCEPSTRDSTCIVVEVWESPLSQPPEVGLKAPCDPLPTRPVIQMGGPDSITNKGFIRSWLSKESLTCSCQESEQRSCSTLQTLSTQQHLRSPGPWLRGAEQSQEDYAGESGRIESWVFWRMTGIFVSLLISEGF